MELHGGDKPASSHGTNDSAHASGSGHRGGGGGSHHAHMIADMRRRFWVCLALTVPVLLLSPMIQDWLGIEDALAFRGDSYLLFGLSTVVYLYGGWPFLKGMRDDLAAKKPGMMTLVAVAISVAYIYSSMVVFGLRGNLLFWELATLIDIMLLGHWLEMRSVMGASSALEKLVELLPGQAHLLRDDGTVEEVAVESLLPGDRVLVRPGEKFPADGEVVKGATSVDLSLVTGESRPTEKGPGDGIIGGAVNGDGAVEVVVEKTGRDTYLSQVVEMVRAAQESRSRTQDLADRAAFWLTLVAIFAGAATLAVWLTVGRAFDFSLERSVAVMVIACPHALGLAIPLVVAVSTALSARNGLLIRDRSSFERSRLLDAVVFDKTGTLTMGSFGVTDVIPLEGGMSEDDVVRMAAAVESRSEHSIARGVAAEAEARGLRPAEPEDFRALPGKGAAARLDGREVFVVSPGYLQENGISVDDPRLNELGEQGKTVIYLLLGTRPAGALALDDMVRAESLEAVRQLEAEGVRCMMLTGDSRQVARRVAAELRLDDHFAEVLPEEKSRKIEELQGQGLVVAMVGDGINDAPALAQADVGIAIGAGTDVAMEAADIVLVRNDPRGVGEVLDLGKATYRKMVQNLWWAAGYNVVAIPLAAGVLYPLGVLLSPAVGAVLMSLSTIIVAFNARRLKAPSRRPAAPIPAGSPRYRA